MIPFADFGAFCILESNDIVRIGEVNTVAAETICIVLPAGIVNAKEPAFICTGTPVLVTEDNRVAGMSVCLDPGGDGEGVGTEFEAFYGEVVGTCGYIAGTADLTCNDCGIAVGNDIVISAAFAVKVSGALGSSSTTTVAASSPAGA